MPIALRLSVVSLLGVLGLAGLVQLPLAPPLATRTGAATDRVLADLANQESQQDARARATEVLGRFVGGEITRYFWGGFSGYLEVLGLEAPEDMDARITEAPQRVQLLLTPRDGGERFVALVQAEDGIPRGVACSGVGSPGRFSRRGDQLLCPLGWRPLQLRGPGTGHRG
jgi:hypothetical protein